MLASKLTKEEVFLQTISQHDALYRRWSETRNKHIITLTDEPLLVRTMQNKFVITLTL